MDKQNMMQIMLAKDARNRAIGKLFKSGELANMPHTQENVATVVHAINFATDQVRSLLAMTNVQRGMRFCWLKIKYGEHGQWQAFCQENFPEISQRSISGWMVDYLNATGEKPRKQLPKYDPDELEDAELVAAIESLDADKKERAPRRALLDHIEKLEKGRAKGAEQYEKLQADLAARDLELEKARQGFHIPDNITDEKTKVEFIRNQFYGWVKTWQTNLPVTDNEEEDRKRLNLHFGLYTDLAQVMTTLWEDYIGPVLETKQAKVRKNKGAAK
jgi:hypothetical protein